MNKVKMSLLVALMTSNLYANPGLVGLSDADLEKVEGQAGVDIKLTMSLNHTSDYKFDQTICASNEIEYCRLAISMNNRYHDGSNDEINETSGERTVTSTGRQQWIVFKGIQGTVIIDQLGLDGTDVSFKEKDSGADKYRAALLMSFDPNKPIKIRNFGFQALAIETDSAPLSNSSNIPGYLQTTKYSTSTNNFDGNNPEFTGTTVGRERGFLGLQVNGNLEVGGTIKMFSCIDHSRC